ncbi:hypothetical protein Aduo_007850 [Ancylostoma duodenale]
MLRFMLLLALCQVAQPATNYDIATAPIVHVIVEMRKAQDQGLEELYDDVEKMFHKFGETYDIHFNRRNLEREEDFDSHGLYRAKYGLIGVNCIDLQDYFLDLDEDTYPVDIVHVICGQFSFSVCMTNSCPKDTFPNFVERRRSDRLH